MHSEARSQKKQVLFYQFYIFLQKSYDNLEEKTYDACMEEKVTENLWDLDIEEVTGHNLEAAGRETVNDLLKNGWALLHVYTLTYKDEKDNGIWRQRPMAILGKKKR